MSKEIVQGCMGTARLIDQEALGAQQEAGEQITVLAEEGEPYAHTTVDLQGDGRKRTHEGIVPAGKVYVGIAPQTG